MNAGRLLVGLLLIVGGLGTLINGAAIYIRILYFSLFTLLLAWLWGRWTLRGLRVSRQARMLRAGAGEVFEEQFEVANLGRLPCLWVEVLNASDLPVAAGSRLLTGIRGRQKRSYAARTWLIRRGRFALGPTRLTTGDPFGLFRFSREFPARETLLVLPRIYELESFVHPPGLLPGGRVIRRKALDITPHAAGLRDYAPGDPLKRIHWPTSVRRGQLTVKEFEQDPQAEVWLFLDAQGRAQAEREHQIEVPPFDGWLFGRRPKFALPPSTFEYAVSIAASLANYFLQQKRAVGFAAVAQSQAILPADRSVRQLDKILETLAHLEPRGNLLLASLVEAQAAQLPQGSSAILITPSVRRELLLAVDTLQRRNLQVVAILLMADSFGGHAGSEELAAALRARRVPTLPVYCGADIAQTLSGFAARTSRGGKPDWISATFTPST